MTDKDNLKDWAIITAIFGPNTALTLHCIIVFGSIIAYLLALGGCLG